MRNAAFAMVEAIVLQSTAKNDALAAADDWFKIDFESALEEAEGVELELSAPPKFSTTELMAPLTTSA